MSLGCVKQSTSLQSTIASLLLLTRLRPSELSLGLKPPLTALSGSVLGSSLVRIGFSIKKYFKEEDLYKDRESQIKAIESTFEAAKKPVSFNEFLLSGLKWRVNPELVS